MQSPIVRLWVETTAKGYRVHGARADHSIRSNMARANTAFGVMAELSGLARKYNLTVVQKPMFWGALPYTQLSVEMFTTQLGDVGHRVVGLRPDGTKETLQQFATEGGAEHDIFSRAPGYRMTIRKSPAGALVATLED